jgi:hypothetical protein
MTSKWTETGMIFKSELTSNLSLYLTLAGHMKAWSKIHLIKICVKSSWWFDSKSTITISLDIKYSLSATNQVIALVRSKMCLVLDDIFHFGFHKIILTFAQCAPLPSDRMESTRIFSKQQTVKFFLDWLPPCISPFDFSSLGCSVQKSHHTNLLTFSTHSKSEWTPFTLWKELGIFNCNASNGQ